MKDPRLTSAPTPPLTGSPNSKSPMSQSDLILSLKNIRLDKVEFRGSIQVFDFPPYVTIHLPSHLSTVFKSKRATVTKAGFLCLPGRQGMYSTN